MPLISPACVNLPGHGGQDLVGPPAADSLFRPLKAAETKIQEDQAALHLGSIFLGVLTGSYLVGLLAFVAVVLALATFVIGPRNVVAFIRRRAAKQV